jgi:hypothetical protein
LILYPQQEKSDDIAARKDYAVPRWARFRVLAYVISPNALYDLGLSLSKGGCQEKEIAEGLASDDREEWVTKLRIDALQHLDRISGLDCRTFSLGYTGDGEGPRKLLAFCSTHFAIEQGPEFWMRNVDPEKKREAIAKVAKELGLTDAEGNVLYPTWRIPDQACNLVMLSSESSRLLKVPIFTHISST